MNKPKVTVLIFTYRGDEGLTPICVDFVKETLGTDTHIVIADDGFNAMFQETREKLIAMGCDYRQTDWPRNGNLLGPFHLEGACKLMAELAKDCDIIVKLDPDACILKRDWIDRLWADNTATMTSAYKLKLNYPMGNSYALKSTVCEALAEDARLYPGWVDCFEDYEIGIRISRLANGDPKHAIRYVCGLAGGFVLTNPWDINYKTCIDSVQVYCSGFNYGSLPLNKKEEYKNKQIEVHSILLAELKKSKNIMAPITEQNIPISISNSPLNNGNYPEMPQVSVPTGPVDGNNMQYLNDFESLNKTSSDVAKSDPESLHMSDVKANTEGVSVNTALFDGLNSASSEKESFVYCKSEQILPEFLEDYKNA